MKNPSGPCTVHEGIRAKKRSVALDEVTVCRYAEWSALTWVFHPRYLCPIYTHTCTTLTSIYFKNGTCVYNSWKGSGTSDSLWSRIISRASILNVHCLGRSCTYCERPTYVLAAVHAVVFIFVLICV